MLAFIDGLSGRLLAGVASAALLAGGLMFAVRTYNSLIEARTVVAEQATVMATMQANHDKTVAALQASATEATARLSARQPARKAISDATETNACNSSTVRGAVASLRSAAAAHNPGSAPSGSR